jgi:hypothetical protein
MAKNDTAANVETPVAAKFSKEQILKSTRYSEKRDLLTALLKDGKTYSHKDVEKLIDDFMKGKVK